MVFGTLVPLWPGVLALALGSGGARMGPEVMTMFPSGFDWSAGLVAAALWLTGFVAIGVLAYFASGARSGSTQA